MRNLMVMFGFLFSLSSAAQAAWQINGVWNGNGFTMYEWPGNQAQLYWTDGAQGFVAYYNPNPNPKPRCVCSVYETQDVYGSRLIIDHTFRVPHTGLYRGEMFSVIGQPVEF